MEAHTWRHVYTVNNTTGTPRHQHINMQRAPNAFVHVSRFSPLTPMCHVASCLCVLAKPVCVCARAARLMCTCYLPIHRVLCNTWKPGANATLPC